MIRDRGLGGGCEYRKGGGVKKKEGGKSLEAGISLENKMCES